MTKHAEGTTFLDRLKTEEQELSKKLEGLKTGLESEHFKEKVGLYQFDLLCVQFRAMQTYQNVLHLRIQDLSK